MAAPTDKTGSQILRWNFPSQCFQFSALPGNVFPADSPHDAASFGQRKFLLQPGEAAPKWDDLRFCFIHFHAKRCRFLSNHFQAGEQMLFVVMDDIAIIHVSPVAFTMHPLFDFVVKLIWNGQRQILTDLATQPQTDQPKHSDQMQNQAFQTLNCDVALQDFAIAS